MISSVYYQEWSLAWQLCRLMAKSSVINGLNIDWACTLHTYLHADFEFLLSSHCFPNIPPVEQRMTQRCSYTASCLSPSLETVLLELLDDSLLPSPEMETKSCNRELRDQHFLPLPHHSTELPVITERRPPVITLNGEDAASVPLLSVFKIQSLSSYVCLKQGKATPWLVPFILHSHNWHNTLDLLVKI